MSKELKDLARLVVQMRTAQRAYFRTRTTEDLQMSKTLEREVDEQCRWILAQVHQTSFIEDDSHE